MNKFTIYAGTILLAMLSGVAQPIYSQNKKKIRTTNSALVMNVKAVVVDENNNPIFGAEVITREGALSQFTDKKGEATIQTKPNGIVLIEALGYEDVVIDLAKGQFPKVIKMRKTEMLSTGKYLHSRPDGGETSQIDLVGAVSSITGEELSTYSDYNLSNALQGRIPGLVAEPTLNGLGNNISTFYVRGLHSKDGNNPIVIIDGMERGIHDVIAEEVEKIEVLKDATAKILYGPRAANGVIVVTTRRGEANKRVIRTSVESGVMLSTRLPEYLDSYQYATLYNEARRNDGMPDFYTSEQLEGYKNSTGPNDLRYPNVDFYDQFIQNHSMYRKAYVDMNGGNDKVRYSMILNYVGGNGFEKIGQQSDMNRLNVRGNLDIEVTDYLKVIADGSVRMEMRKYSSVDNSSLFGSLSSVRPNEYPFTISPEDLGLQPADDGIPYFGASLLQPNNLYANVMYGGFTQERYIVSQTNFGLDFNLGRFVKGLKASAFITFDNYNNFKQGQNNTYPTYAIRGYINDEPVFQQMKALSEQSDQSKKGELTKKNTALRANVGYENSFGAHEIDAMLAYNYYVDEVTGSTQDVKNSNTSLRLNYVYDKRYAFEGDLALMGSNRFYGSTNNKYFLSGALGAGWVISNEGFLKDSEVVNFLKIKASYGILGYDGGTEYLLYKTAWQKGGNVSFGEQNMNAATTVDIVRIGNPYLKWETSNELNVGLEGMFFDNCLRVEANYFNEIRDNIIGSNSSQYMAVLGSYVSQYNMGKVKNHGFEMDLSWRSKVGDLSYQIGANMIWSKNKLLEWNEVDYTNPLDKGLKTIGLPTDAMVGYEALGLFGKDVSIEGVDQRLGHYQIGDIAYSDLNADGVVDDRDKKVIGNSFPRVSGGIDVNLQYKNWGLYLLGSAELGVDSYKNNSYYWMNGEDKYSVVALNRYHPENNPDGWYPRLTTTEGDNNFVGSTFWIQDASFFRLKNVELSYTISSKRANSIIKKIKLYGRGTNLFVLSSEKNLDPEVMNAGVTNYPVYRTFTGGVTLTF